MKILSIVRTNFQGKLMSRVLENKGYAHDYVLTFEEAKEWVKIEDYDLILFQAESGDYKHFVEVTNIPMIGMHYNKASVAHEIFRLTENPAIAVPFENEKLVTRIKEAVKDKIRNS